MTDRARIWLVIISGLVLAVSGTVRDWSAFPDLRTLLGLLCVACGSLIAVIGTVQLIRHRRSDRTGHR
ncbi:Uncharacterised protein [Mycobacteroides abscessus subsp. abscessus]|uniref:hypothetical protein n=1 Tax=Mycobacteroides abscessus TaxID=36809 RepID=UPI0009A5BFE7|nr:hypothetical protein [Mycobacteroides abscessus]SKR42872.1 Uncharacterised protein [Mycobacteroides abscessus subsp. abscessus]